MDVIALIPGLHLLRFPVGHAYLWQDADGLTLVDTSAVGSGPLLAEAIRGLGHQPSDVRRLVLTHFHADHVGAAAEVAAWGDVTVLAHRADVAYIEGTKEGPPPDLADWERELMAQVATQLPTAAPAPVRVDRALDDGDLLDFGGVARAVAVPGHTPGSVAIHLPEHGVLFAGDTIARSPDGQVMLGVFNVDPAEAVRSFVRQARLEPEIVCFGHGEPLTRNAAAELRIASERQLSAGL